MIVNETFKNANKIKMIVLYVRNLFKHILDEMNLTINDDERLISKKDDELLINNENMKQKEYNMR